MIQSPKKCCFGVVGLRRVDDEQAGSPDELFGRGEERSGSSRSGRYPEMSSVACSSEIKDGLCFVERRRDDHR